MSVLAEAVAGNPIDKAIITDYIGSLTPVQAMNPANDQLSGLRRKDPNVYSKAVGLALIRFTEIVNIANTLTTDQIDDLITRIGKEYYYFRFDEVLYVLEKGANGKYGPLYQTIDASVIMSWMEKYDVNERTPRAVELSRDSQADKMEPMTLAQLKDFYKKASVKVENPLFDTSHVRMKDKANSAEQAYRNFRNQYLRTKRQDEEAQAETDRLNDPTFENRTDHQRADAESE
jgi:hypothetical protein